MNLYLNDVGILNALGSGKEMVLDGLLSGSTHGMRDCGPLITGRHSVCGVVQDSLAELPDHLAEFDCRNNRLLASALDQILPAINDAVEAYGKHRVAVIIGTSTSGIAAGEDARAKLHHEGKVPKAFHYRQQEIGTSAEFAARYLDISGPHYTISTACSSSSKAFASAARLIRSDWCDVAIVGGSDSLCGMTLNGFDALESLAPERCNPFSKNRRGINIGEGACVAVLSKRPAPIELMGCGESSDGYHMAAPDPSGKGAESAIRSALASAGISSNDVEYINLHGTATRKNDEMEGIVIERVFGSEIPCSSTKTQIGHTLGAAGSQELGLCWLVLDEHNKNNYLPHHLWDSVQDPAIPAINLIGETTKWKKGIFLSNTFGFGGSNASLILRRSQ
jgi:3-oxoacyl-[acyl-carrier-protein] synthase-1